MVPRLRRAENDNINRAANARVYECVNGTQIVPRALPARAQNHERTVRGGGAVCRRPTLSQMQCAQCRHKDLWYMRRDEDAYAQCVATRSEQTTAREMR